MSTLPFHKDYIFPQLLDRLGIGGLDSYVQRHAATIKALRRRRRERTSFVHDLLRGSKTAPSPHELRAALERSGYLGAGGGTGLPEVDTVPVHPWVAATGHQAIGPVANPVYDDSDPYGGKLAVGLASSAFASLNNDRAFKRMGVSGEDVLAFGLGILRKAFPLVAGGTSIRPELTYTKQTRFTITHSHIPELTIHVGDHQASLRRPEAFYAYTADGDTVTSIYLTRNGALTRLMLDGHGRITDIQAHHLTAIHDLEDAQSRGGAGVEAQIHGNVFGLVGGTLTTEKGGIPEGNAVTLADGTKHVLPARPVDLYRMAGLELDSTATTDHSAPCCLLDYFVTIAAHKHFDRESCRLVIPKTQGLHECQTLLRLLHDACHTVGYPLERLQVFWMDEDIWTTWEIEDILALPGTFASNTGYLDWSASMQFLMRSMGGLMVPFTQFMNHEFYLAYEERSTVSCYEAGLPMVGKGMFTNVYGFLPMVAGNDKQFERGATCHWTPNPTGLGAVASTMALAHDVPGIRQRILSEHNADVTTRALYDLPVMGQALSPADAKAILRDSASRFFLRAARVVALNLGASAVPDINGVSLMEDHATNRIGMEQSAALYRAGLVSEGDLRELLTECVDLANDASGNIAGYKPLPKDDFDHPFMSMSLTMLKHGTTDPAGFIGNDLYRCCLRMQEEGLAPVYEATMPDLR